MNPSARALVLPRWSVLVFALFFGALGSLAQAPTSLAPFMLLMSIGAFALFDRTARPGQAFALGWVLGLAYFGLSLRWIVEPFQVDAAAHGWMAPFALVLLAAGLALIWGAGFGLARRVSGQIWPLVFFWSAAELVRAYAFTGFPWANPAQGLLESAAGQGLSLMGPHGLTMGLFALAAAVAALRRPMRMAGSAFVLAALLLLPEERPAAAVSEHVVRLVQPNTPQDEKWDPEKAPLFVDRQLSMTAASGTPDLVVWSEMAIPYRMSVAAPVFEAAAEAARGAPVLMGAMRDDASGAFFNAALVVDAEGQIAQHYDKHHLVPFGEYMPLPGLFRSLGIQALAERTETGYTPGAGPALVDLPGIGPALPLICYEAVFPQDLRGTARPRVLVNITNDAWFGQTLGPQQHLALARMRAIEQGLPMIRVAGAGISAMIDPYGRVTASLALNEMGYLDAVLPEALPATLYARTGDMPYAFLALLGLILSIFRTARH